MPKKLIDCYEITVKFSIQKKDWDADNDKISKELIADKIQQGIETPLEDISVSIIK